MLGPLLEFLLFHHPLSFLLRMPLTQPISLRNLNCSEAALGTCFVPENALSQGTTTQGENVLRDYLQYRTFAALVLLNH